MVDRNMNVYDFDNTIYNGDSTFDFYIYCLRKHKEILKMLPSLVNGFTKFYILKKGSKTEFKENMYKFLQFIDTEKEVQLFWKKYIGNIKEWYYIIQKADDVIISASPEFLLRPLCKKIGIKYLIASNVSASDGKYTGINCHGKEKVRLFKMQFNESIDKFYSDSYSDTPLAEISEQAFMVKGNKISKWIFK